MSIFGQREGAGGGGGVEGKGVAFEFFRIFWSNSPPLGLENCSNPITYPLSAFKKTAVWGKICGQNPQDWDKGSIQLSHLCRTPHLRLNVFVPASQGCAVAEPGGRRCPTSALG